jgi:hypothetical protein
MVAESTDTEGNVTSRPTSPREVFEDWMYGERLHDDEDRLARIAPFRDSGVHRFTALSVGTDLMRVYVSLSHWLLPPVLAEPSLFLSPLTE